jgi:ubiquinone biosynthesis protein Coq4
MYKFLIHVRSQLLVCLTHKMALPVLKIIRKPEIFPYSLENLQQLPGNSLGRQLADFLERKKLALLPYYARHDIKHILLDYDTTDEGEVCLQCFMAGNGHLSFPVIATILYGYCTMPEHWKLFRQAYRRGKVATRISHWDWFNLLTAPVFLLKEKINSRPYTIL